MSSAIEVQPHVKLVSITPNAQHTIAYCARVSNPQNQENLATESKLLRYLVKHQHWSPFELAHMTIEIKTTRAISSQIIRHRSFSFQEFSQRFANVHEYILPHFRIQDTKNKQGSFDALDTTSQESYQAKAKQQIEETFALYQQMIQDGIAKESARLVLPMCTATTIYMSGTIRSWIHYLQLRTQWDTQKEHREIAEQIQSILLQECPWLSEVLTITN
jgi:thymidylate synthase (FAD)